ncbi:hypothetical protein ADL04_15990 [Streptomyces sp. NRRL B-3648]|nr:hypothetical protein ADL04_15990 [Streptomyces sp. NRRL B-3648]
MLAGGTTAPAQAASEGAGASVSSAPSNQSVIVAVEGWTTALRSGDPVRSTYSSSGSVLWRTAYEGQSLHYYAKKTNQSGNVWYQLDSPRWGWIYCGNVAAPC